MLLTPTTNFVIGLSRLGLIMIESHFVIGPDPKIYGGVLYGRLSAALSCCNKINNQKKDTGKIGNRFYHGKSAVIYAKTPCHGYRPPSAFAAALLARVLKKQIWVNLGSGNKLTAGFL